MKQIERQKTLILNSTNLSEKLIFNILNGVQNHNVLIISYEKETLNFEEIQRLSSNYGFDSFELYSPKTKSVYELHSSLSTLQEESIVLIIGLEKIFLNTTQSNFQIKSGTKLFNYHSYENIDSVQLITYIEYLCKQFNFHFLFLLQADISNSERITSELQEYDIEILSIKYEDDDSKNMQKIIFEELENTTYEEAMDVFKKYKSELSQLSIRNLQVMIWLQHGFQDKAIEFLKDNFGILHSSEKKQLADLYYFDEKHHEADVIANILFQENPLLVGLNTLLLKTAIQLNKFENVYEHILEIDTRDVKALEICADYFTKDKTFDLAIEFRKQLFSISGMPYHLLLSEILKIEKDKPTNGNLAEQQILSVLAGYDDEVLEIEKNYRLGRIWFEVYSSPYQAYYHFKNVLKHCNNIHAVDAAKYRMKLLGNHGYSNKIIKTGYQRKYPDRLPIMRVNELFNSLLILTYDDKGYLIWQDFLDNSQTKQTWKKYLSSKVITILRKIDSQIHVDDINKSAIFNEFKENELLEMIRFYKSGNLSYEQITIFKESAEALVSQSQNVLEQIWIRYYIANFFMYIGEMQLANNHSISLWYFANRIDDKKNSKIARLLGTLSWGMAQYKNGKEIEGIACIATTIEYFVEIQEIVPLLEDGLGVLNIWVQSNRNLFSESDFDFFIQFFKRLIPKNAQQDEVYEYIAKEDWNTIYSLFGYKVYNPQNYDAQWAFDFYHYVLATAKSKHLTIDFDLIMNNIENLIHALVMRKDQRAKLLNWFAELIFMGSDNKYSPVERWKTSLKLLTISIQDLEEKRKNLKNTYERAFISDESRIIYELYLRVNIIVFKGQMYLNEIEEFKIIQNILNAFDYLSLRTQKEKKINKSGAQVTIELEKIEKEYLQLLEELSQYSVKNFKEAFLSEEYKEKSQRYAELRRILEEKHPIYMNDSFYEEVPITIIQSKMETDEIYYQYIDTEIFICYFVITNDFIDFGFINNKGSFDKKDVDNLAHQIQTFTSSTQYDIKKIEESYSNLSLYYFKPLLGYITSNKYKKIYINHDLSLPFISSNLIRIYDKWLVEEVDSIVNLMNRHYFLDKKINTTCAFSIANLGKKTDMQFIETDQWISESQIRSQKNIENFENNFSSITSAMESNQTNSLLIISHGIQGSNQNILTGALSIEGEKKTYTIDDFKFIHGLECMAFLSCSGGSLSVGEHETSNTIISSVLSKNINSAVLCRWDVFLEPSLKIFEKIIEMDRNIDEVINIAIKEYLRQNPNMHPVFWAGIEVWKN
ncbi:MAG: hypothetical protein PHQ90_00450 [Sulfuricurvum sp.]|uniref:hypothetical protein n=1 Tax=Sulfuricurvum sp. TaxID=2025608 RepID=UPI00261E3FE3|nr:hypothetical protein [Sulfuricurvum sp.]MDD2367735.1 hypothetical protein [Sulfuricurvum sp.]MDD2949402.1 hypothetical protein [Sulfuricurvum sp.]MDD5118163.1 hypothetical protein [Sulfuricurvum sp.]